MVAQQNVPAMNRAPTAALRSHYDRLSIFYHWLWGEHIHHGFWRDGESPQEAQVSLIEELARRAGVPFGAKVLDVGCGLGGAAFWLAQNRGCSVVGITISPVKKRLADKRARSLRLSECVQFAASDATKLDFEPKSFDVVWNIECSEHLADKAQFVSDAAHLLRGNGVFALCTWFSAEHARGSQLIAQIAAGMLCPSLATFRQYSDWLVKSGFADITAADVTPHVAKTWDVCHDIIRRAPTRWFVPLMSRQTRRFVASFELMRRAYRERVLGYAMFTARKP